MSARDVGVVWEFVVDWFRCGIGLVVDGSMYVVDRLRYRGESLGYYVSGFSTFAKFKRLIRCSVRGLGSQ